MHGSRNISYMVDVTNIRPIAVCRAVKKATELKLISLDYAVQDNFRVRRVRLTENGRRTGKLLSEVYDIPKK